MSECGQARQARRGLALLLAGDAVSITGTTMTTIAVPWFVLTTTGSAARAGVAVFASLLPIVIAAIFGGAIVDRVGYRRSSVACDLASGLLTVAIPVLFLTVGLGFAPLLALLFFRWLLASPGETARRALVMALAVSAAVRMERATAAFDAVSRGARMVGAPVAGVLITIFGATRFGPMALLFVDAATFGLSALLIGCGVPRSRSAAAQDHETGIGADLDADLDGYLARLREGLVFLWREPVLRALSVTILLLNMLSTGWSQVLLPVYAREVLGDPRVLGLLLGLSGAGAVVGALAYGVLGARLSRRKTYAFCCFAATVPVALAFAARAPLPMLLGVQALSGLVLGALNPLLSVVEFERIPTRLRARVMGAGDAGAYAGMPVGGLLAGGLAGSVGLTATMLIFAGIYLAVCLPLFVGKVWRGLDARIPGLPAAAVQANR